MGGILSAACSPESRSDQYTVYKDEQTIIDALHAGADLHTLQRILARGCVIDHGGPILHQAMTTGSIASALLMLRLGRLVLHPRDSYLLIVALQLPHSLMQLELLHLLLAQGCLRGFNVNYIHHGQDGDDDTDTVFTPLSYALAHGQPDAALLLLHFGADPTVSLGSLYQGLYTPFSEWCRRVLLAPSADPPAAPVRRASDASRRRASSPRDIHGRSEDTPQVSVWGTPLGLEDPPPAPLLLSPNSGSSSSGTAGFESSLGTSSSPLDVRQQQLLFASAVRQPPARRHASPRKGSSAWADSPRTLKRTHSASSEREDTKAQLRLFQRESSLQGLGALGSSAEPPAYLRRSAVMRRRLRLGHPMCTAKLARAMIHAGCDPNECVGASGVFKLVGVPAVQHTLAWPEVVLELLKGGADPDGHPQVTVTPLLQACDSCDVPWQTVHHLLQAGANPSLACLVSAPSSPDTQGARGGRAQDTHDRRRSISTHDLASRLDISALSGHQQGGATRRRSASAPSTAPHRHNTPRGASRNPPPQPDLTLFMTPFEALCGRIVEEVGGGEDADAGVDLPQGALLPPDTEAIARLLPAWGADMCDARRQLELLQQVVPVAARAARREAHWGLRSGIVCFRDAFRAAYGIGPDALTSIAGSVRSAPNGMPSWADSVPCPSGHSVTSRSLLLSQAQDRRVSVTSSSAAVPIAAHIQLGKGESATVGKALTYAYGRPQGSAHRAPSAALSPSAAAAGSGTVGPARLIPAVAREQRRSSLAEVGHSVSARSVRAHSLTCSPSKGGKAAPRRGKKLGPVHAWH